MFFQPVKSYRSLRRYQQIIITLSRYGFSELAGRLNLLYRLGLKKTPPSPEVAHQASRAVRVRLMLEQLGPSFIKLGQILSTRADLLPPDIIAELANLREHVAHLPWDQMKKKSQGRLDKLEEQFSEFDPVPIASASIAQVYRATLKSGREVAVKIVRPGTRETFDADLVVFEQLGHLIKRSVKEAQSLDLDALSNQVRSSIAHELDMQHEGRNADIFRANFADDKTVYVPQVYWEYCQKDVLVMEFIRGMPMTEYLATEQDPARRRLIARRGTRLALKQIFLNGFFHADPHPGNLMVLEGEVICLLDYGMFGRLEPNALEALGRVLHAVVRKDMERFFRAHRELGVLPDEVPIEMKLAILDLIEQYHGIPLRQIDVRKLLHDVVQIVHRFHVGIRHDFLFLIKALGTIEAVGRSLDPDYDMIRHFRPFVRKMTLDRLGPQRVLNQSILLSEDMVKLLQETPEHLLEILRDMRRGAFQLEFHHKGLEQASDQLDTSSDKIVLGLVIAALIVASSMLAQSRIGPELNGFPLIGGLGFLIAGVTGLWVIFDILRRRR